jgi:hypothetical protein
MKRTTDTPLNTVEALDAARAAERKAVVDWLHAHEHSGLYDEPFDEAADGIERGAHLR